MAAKVPFRFGVRYWPRRRDRAIPLSWGPIDRGAVREELAQIADLGFNSLSLHLRWEDFQPSRETIGVAAMHALEQTLEAAHEVNLSVALSLMDVNLAGSLHLPRWAVGLRPGDSLLAAQTGQPVPSGEGLPILCETRYLREPVRDLYRDESLRRAQQYLLREVLGYFAQHPAAQIWQLSGEFERVYPPQALAQVRDWWLALREQTERYHPQTIAGPVSIASLTRQASLRPALLAEREGALMVAVQHLAPLPVQTPWQPLAVRFLHALVAQLVQSEQGRAGQVFISDLGLPVGQTNQGRWYPDEEFGRASECYLAEAEQQAAFLELALPALYSEGAAGIFLAALHDPDPAGWAGPPLSRSLRWRGLGLFDAEGHERPAVKVVRQFADRLRQRQLGSITGPPALPLDPERFWHAPAQQIHRLFNEWQTALRERDEPTA